MDVQLLVYDLSRGLARHMSLGLLGFQLDAVYHTSIELAGREYVYDGGIIAIAPGSSHLGQPMQKMHLGTTSLPMDVIEEYLDSIRPIFTLEAYHVFRHNCNNFSDSLAKFLVGKGIPSHIINMPEAVMASPMGHMLLPQLTHGVNAGRSSGSILGLQDSSTSAAPRSAVRSASTPGELSRLLDAAKQSCAVVFFTSATCPPCKTLYPLFDQLALEMSDKAVFITMDISRPQAAMSAEQFAVRATPTFVTFLRGDEERRWAGADAARLRSSVELLVHMAHPAHLHEWLRLPTFANPDVKPVLFAKAPPMAKLTAKMGDGLAGDSRVQGLVRFIEQRSSAGPQDAVVPDAGQLSQLVQDATATLPPERLFAVVDLFRCALVDARVSGYFSEEEGHKAVRAVLDAVNGRDECPYALRLVTLHAACNLFSTPLFADAMLRDARLCTPVIQLVSSSFLDDGHGNTRVAAASLLFNAALAHRRGRAGAGKASLSEADQVELAASVVEAIAREDQSAEALRGMLSALGHLVYGSAADGELADLLRTLDAQGTIAAKRAAFADEVLISEVADELLGKGLRRP